MYSQWLFVEGIAFRLLVTQDTVSGHTVSVIRLVSTYNLGIILLLDILPGFMTKYRVGFRMHHSGELEV